MNHQLAGTFISTARTHGEGRQGDNLQSFERHGGRAKREEKRKKSSSPKNVRARVERGGFSRLPMDLPRCCREARRHLLLRHTLLDHTAKCFLLIVRRIECTL